MLFYFYNIRTDQLTFGVAVAVFTIAGEMRRLPAYFDNPDGYVICDLLTEQTHGNIESILLD